MEQRSNAVLVVDPDRRVRGALHTLIAAAGYAVVPTADSATAALSAAQRHRPTLAVVDPLLDGHGGGDDLIRQLHLATGTTVVALVDTPELGDAAVAAGAAVALAKDCGPEALLRAIEELLTRPDRREETTVAQARPPTVLPAAPTAADAVDEDTEVHELVPERFERVAGEHPDKPCLVDAATGTTMTFADVQRAVVEETGRLRRAGITAVDKVAVLSPNDPRVIVSTLALLSLGAAWLPVNSRESPDTVGALLDQLACDALIAHGDLLPTAEAVARAVPSLRGVLPLDGDDLGSGGAPDTVLQARATPGDPADVDLAAVFPTGGTTGRPKGVAFSHRRLARLVEAYGQVQARPDDIYLAAAPLTHVGGRICISVIASGATAVILPRFDEREVLEAIERHRVTTLTVTSTMLYRLLDCPERDRFDLSSLRALVYGAGPTAVSRIRQALEAFGPVLEGGYGQTEAPMLITRFRAQDHLVDGAPAPDSRLRSVGRPTSVSDVRIVDEAGNGLPAGTPGRILVRGPFTMDGYYRDPAATAERQVGEHRRTGDLGVLDEDGFLTLVGRETDLIITGGFNVYPREVEDVIAAEPGVRECAVIGLPDERWGEVVVAVVSCEAGVEIDPDALRLAVRPLLGGVKTPKRIEIVEDLPRNDVGKIVKRLLVDERTP